MNPDFELSLPRARIGIYHLLRGGRVVYVGQSKNLLARIGNHHVTDCDSVRFFFCDKSELDTRELEDIVRLQPERNREGVHTLFRSGCGGKRAIYCLLPQYRTQRWI